MRRGRQILRARLSRRKLEQDNAIRKVKIDGVNGSDWGMLGYEFVDPDTGATVCEGEDDDPIPVFQGIGIFARPVGARGEAMMLHVGNQADHPILAAVRDEDGRRAMVGAFSEPAAGEVAIYNGQGTARVLIKADGAIAIELSALGPKVQIGTKASLLREPGIKATTYRTAETVVMTALSVFVTAMAPAMATSTHNSPLEKSTLATALTALTAAITAFAAGDATYKTVVLEAE